jgi:phosphate/sulfate permease
MKLLTRFFFFSFLFLFSFEQGISSAAFHGSVKNATKDENLTRWLSGEILVMCATVAFGMGVDKADVRFGTFVACREGQAGSFLSLLIDHLWFAMCGCMEMEWNC